MSTEQSEFTKAVLFLDKAEKEGGLGGSLRNAFGQRYKQKRTMHASLVLEGLASGVLAATSWEKPISIPQGFTELLNWAAFNLQCEFPEGIISTTYASLEKRILRFIEECPASKSWKINSKAVAENAIRHIDVDIERIMSEAAEADDEDCRPMAPNVISIMAS